MMHATRQLPDTRSRLSIPGLVVSIALSGGLVSGCAKKPAPAPAPEAVRLPDPPAREVPAPNRTVVDDFKRRGFDAREVDEGVLIYLPTVYLFDFDSAAVASDAKQQLREIASVLNDSMLGGRRVTVEGHADSKGSQEYNLKLSDDRAEAVITELVSGGVDRERLHKRAFGKDRPLEPNRKPDGSDNPEGRARNRRVSLIVENPVP